MEGLLASAQDFQLAQPDATLAESLAAQRSRVMTIPREMASLESLYVQLRAARGKGCRL